MISPPKGYMSAENRSPAKNQRSHHNNYGTHQSRHFSIQGKEEASNVPNGQKAGNSSSVSHPEAGGARSPSEKPTLVVIKNEDEIVRPSGGPPSPYNSGDGVTHRGKHDD